MSGLIILINGGSSAGKSSLVRELQNLLPELWLGLGIDTFIGALPARLTGEGTGIQFEDDGRVDVGTSFTELENLWMLGIAAMGRAGGRVIVDDAFLGGPPSQRRWREALEGVDVGWVGVHCDPEIAEERARARGDRPAGMARRQALTVHRGIAYDVEVDTGVLTTAEAAAVIADTLSQIHRPG
ncbi:MAG TPA: AAA family ATPase [Kineosporiaceae bacterium]|nr:AAA family ATPase [Kineosporiaceae bacterium]